MPVAISGLSTSNKTIYLHRGIYTQTRVHHSGVNRCHEANELWFFLTPRSPQTRFAKYRIPGANNSFFATGLS